MKHIIKIISTLLSIILIINIINLNIIPNKYLLIIISIELFLLLLGIILNINKKKTLKIIGIILLIINIIINSIGLYYINHTNKFIKQSFNNNLVEKNKYNVIVLKESNYNNIEEIKIIGYLKQDINYKEKINNELKEYNSIYELYEDLLNKKIESIILEDTYIDLLKDDYKDIEEKIKIIYSFDITNEIKKQVETKELNPINIYISGSDSRSGSIEAKSRTDVNMIVTINPNTNKILLTSIPRDYYVQLHNTTGYKDKFTHSGIYGIEMSKQTLEDLFNIKIDYTIKVGFNSVVKIIDLLGGIDINSDMAFQCRCGDGIPSNRYIIEGINHVNGAEALCFSRQRKVYQTGDNHRILNQQVVLEGIISKLTKEKSILIKYDEILNSLSDLYRTDIPESLIKLYIKNQLENNTKWQIEKQVVTGYGSMDITYSMPGRNLYVMIPDMESVKKATENIEKSLSE